MFYKRKLIIIWKCIQCPHWLLRLGFSVYLFIYLLQLRLLDLFLEFGFSQRRLAETGSYRTQKINSGVRLRLLNFSYQTIKLNIIVSIVSCFGAAWKLWLYIKWFIGKTNFLSHLADVFQINNVKSFVEHWHCVGVVWWNQVGFECCFEWPRLPMHICEGSVRTW